MAVTVGQFAYAIQASADGTSLLPELSERLSRLLGTATATVELLAPSAPSEVKDSAVIAMGAYLFDQPPAGRHASFANAFHNSGAGSLLSFWTMKGFAGSAGAAAGVSTGGIDQDAVNALIAIHAAILNAHHEPGTGGGTTDQTARDAAAAAQSEIDTHEASTHNTDSAARASAAEAQAEIDTHESSTHNTDLTAQSTALNARQVGEQAQTELETHRNSTHNHDATARTAARAAKTTADTARTELTTHEGTPHGGGGGVDQTARTAAAAAQTEIDTHEASEHNSDTVARSTARNARQTAEQAQTGLETHEASPHNHDAGARTAAANAQSAVEDHGRHYPQYRPGGQERGSRGSNGGGKRRGAGSRLPCFMRLLRRPFLAARA